MTANAFTEDMEKSKEAGMDEHLSKPVDIAVAMGRKGGSNVAAAICNALLYSAAEMLDPAARGWR